jgi:hypothetical protein
MDVPSTSVLSETSESLSSDADRLRRLEQLVQSKDDELSLLRQQVQLLMSRLPAVPVAGEPMGSTPTLHLRLSQTVSAIRLKRRFSGRRARSKINVPPPRPSCCSSV